MLVTFTTDDYGDVIMFGDVALAMLHMMGHTPTVPGAILAADVPAALGRLTRCHRSGKGQPACRGRGRERRRASPRSASRIGRCP